MNREDSARIAIALERIAKSLEKIACTTEEAFPEYGDGMRRLEVRVEPVRDAFRVVGNINTST